MTDDSGDLGPDPTSQALLRLVPTIGPVLATWRQDTYERRQRRSEALGAAAAEGIGAEELLRQVTSDERLTDMFNAAVDAAVATASAAKIRLLGRALASGVTAADGARVDEAEQLLRIAVELDPVDLRAIRALERWRASDPEAKVMHALRVSSAAAGPIVARLVRLSLLQVDRSAFVDDKKDPDDDQVTVDEVWSVTDTAAALMELLQQPEIGREAGEVRPEGAPWAGFTPPQAEALEHLIANRFDWHGRVDLNKPTAKVLGRLRLLGVPSTRVLEAMRSVGVDRQDLVRLEGWMKH